MQVNLVSLVFQATRAHLVTQVIQDPRDLEAHQAHQALPVFLVAPVIQASLVFRVKLVFLALVALRGDLAFPPALVLP